MWNWLFLQHIPYYGNFNPFSPLFSFIIVRGEKNFFIDSQRGFLILKNQLFQRKLILRGDFEVRILVLQRKKNIVFCEKTHLFLETNLRMRNLCKTSKFSQKVVFEGGFWNAFLWENAKFFCEKTHFDVKNLVRMRNLCKVLVQNHNMPKCGIHASYLTLHSEKERI